MANAIQPVEPMSHPFTSHERDWGTRVRLLEVLAVMLVVYGFGFLLTRYSGGLNFPVRVTSEKNAGIADCRASASKQPGAWVEASVDRSIRVQEGALAERRAPLMNSPKTPANPARFRSQASGTPITPLSADNHPG